MNLADAMERAKVLEWELQQQLRPHMEKLKPRPSIYIPDFIAANQSERADNVLKGKLIIQGEGGRGTFLKDGLDACTQNLTIDPIVFGLVQKSSYRQLFSTLLTVYFPLNKYFQTILSSFTLP